MIAVVDYGRGNLGSVEKALARLGMPVRITDDPRVVADAEAVVLPGDGAFDDVMGGLARLGLIDPLRAVLDEGRPFFGICVGYQVLFEGGEENPGVAGLGVLRGQVVRFPAEPGLKVPHMGWNNVNPAHPGDPAWAGLGPEPFFYFVHSYYPEPLEKDVTAGTTRYAGRDFAAAVQRGRMIATHFHPEKSQATGLRLLGNFLTQFA